MAITCIVFMVLGFIMAKRYVLSKDKNQMVAKYLEISRHGRIKKLKKHEKEELKALRKSLS